MHKVARFCALLLASHLSSAANAACTDFSRSACRLDALLETDGNLNAVYSKVLSARSESERGEFRADQRRWLRSRDQTCELGNLSQRGDWMKVLSSDMDKFNCVYAITRARLDELRKLPTGMLDDLAQLTDRRETTFPVSHSSGKWYAEISFLAKGNDPADKEYVQVVKDAVFYGTWVMLQPLPPGDHTISFGGELPALNTYRNVTYKIHIE